MTFLCLEFSKLLKIIEDDGWRDSTPKISDEEEDVTFANSIDVNDCKHG